MKDIRLMHHFLRSLVWQGDGEIFVGHGKYTFDILQRFHMQDCKHMDTPLSTNWRKDDASTRDAVGGTICRKLVGSLM